MSSATDLPVTDIFVTESTIYVTAPGYGRNFYKSTDGGGKEISLKILTPVTWTQFNTPKIPFWTVWINPHNAAEIYVGTGRETYW